MGIFFCHQCDQHHDSREVDYIEFDGFCFCSGECENKWLRNNYSRVCGELKMATTLLIGTEAIAQELEQERSALHTQNAALVEALEAYRQATKNTTYPEEHAIWEAENLAEAALAKGKEGI